MPTDRLCSETQFYDVMPWVMIAFYVLMFGVIYGLKMLGKLPARKARVWPMIIGLSFAIGMMFYLRGKENRVFQGFTSDASSIALLRFWPSSPIVLPAAAIDGVTIVRGRHFTKGKRVADRAYLRLGAATGNQVSCETANLSRMLTVAHELAALTHRPLEFQERCPDPDNRTVPATEADLLAPGNMNVPAECSSSKASTPTSASPSGPTR